jgi:cobalamin biosynthesis protein CobT
MRNFSTLLLESDEKYSISKKQINNNFSLSEAEGDEFEDHQDDAMEDMENQAIGHTPDETDTEDGGEGEGDGTEDGSTEGEETPADGESTEGDSTGTEDGEGESPDGENPEGDEATDVAPIDPNSGKKIHLFKNYKSIYDLLNNFIDKVTDFKEVMDSDEGKKGKYETVEFIEEKLYNLKGNIKLILTDKIKTMDYDKAKTLFVYVKSEVNLLINLFNKISNTKQ